MKMHTRLVWPSRALLVTPALRCIPPSSAFQTTAVATMSFRSTCQKQSRRFLLRSSFLSFQARATWRMRAQAGCQEGQAQAAIGPHPQPVSTTRTPLLTTALRHKQASSCLKDHSCCAWTAPQSQVTELEAIDVLIPQFSTCYDLTNPCK